MPLPHRAPWGRKLPFSNVSNADIQAAEKFAESGHLAFHTASYCEEVDYSKLSLERLSR